MKIKMKTATVQELNGKLAMKAARYAGYRYRTSPSLSLAAFDCSNEFDIEAKLAYYILRKKRRISRKKLKASREKAAKQSKPSVFNVTY